ncbi:unnamed protein product [Angiostrongylus costaricensis]|uniref:EGF-like domain-containing protein n=1 Tax=Angiostrongylus costaricensis TaxID=334426 RepID=A0A0R3PIE1_ANGCS|nr:unnamed protein product [Angiostrongylus costaricensis]
MTCVKIHSGSSPREGEQAYPKQCRDSTDCHQYGHCVVGSDSKYVCECLPGYRGDGIQHCVVADRCNPADPSACAQNAECIYEEVERAYVCKCVRGFTGDGVHCIPHARPQTCQEEPRLCHANAQCVYNSGSNTYVCICKPGTRHLAAQTARRMLTASSLHRLVDGNAGAIQDIMETDIFV